MYDSLPKNFWVRTLLSTGFLILAAGSVLALACLIQGSWNIMWILLLWAPMLISLPRGTRLYYIQGVLGLPVLIIMMAVLSLAGLLPVSEGEGSLIWGALLGGIIILFPAMGFWRWHSYLNMRGPSLAAHFMVTANSSPMRAGLNLAKTIEDAILSGHGRYIVRALQCINPEKVCTDAMIPLLSGIREICNRVPGDPLSLTYLGLTLGTLSAMRLRNEPPDEIEEAHAIFFKGMPDA